MLRVLLFLAALPGVPVAIYSKLNEYGQGRIDARRAERETQQAEKEAEEAADKNRIADI